MATHQSDAPLVLTIARLGRRPGTMMAVRRTVDAPVRIGLDLEAIEPGAPLTLDLQLQSVSEGVLVTGTAAAPTSAQCARCLTEFADHIEVRLTALYAYPQSTTEATTEDDEIGRIVDDTVDLEQALIDEVGLALPLSPLCRPDCPGLCAQCGVALATADPDHHHEVIDPRWAKLAGLLEDRP
ncbi:DUF177 domain-containing protein [Mycolicibacillus parakoreensis]|uniref:DUF177 domain-containing protein n=1 Tax=Mycolicibacillus parakoreensis TaxID=1069221 RepID=A0ABY3U2E9_9MYCO|nr:DUF177 domain-containing protein [Mycolicibacillus parakoreensis]MCV7315850.1 DUF177 domain-containing protein [Mycolicibacillus parakoreensis]ULN51732.1 DUF177 domain-containing protein [Mycolicibacillus parakoreensis]HLS00199.1 DUF177 domain-containing protein [Mycolicibacillus parakoreensis]